MADPQEDSNVTKLPTKGRKDRKRQERAMTNLDQINTLQEKTGWTDSELEKNLGYKGSSLNGWRRDGKCPVTTSLAAECLIRRMGLAGKPKHYIITVGSESVELIMGVLNKFGITVKEL